jgi:hypothetical protein
MQYLLKGLNKLLPAPLSFSKDPFIVANPAGYERVKRLLQQNNQLKNTPQRIATTADLNDTIGRMDELSLLVKKYSIQEIILCENGLSFKEIIRFYEMLPKNLRIRVSANNAGSIVGSDFSMPSGELSKMV